MKRLLYGLIALIFVMAPSIALAGQQAPADVAAHAVPVVVEPQSAQRPLPPRPAAAKVRDMKLHGYVTAVTSPTEFQIEDYRITRDASFVLDLENASDDLKFRPEDIRVGVELVIKGAYNESTGELRAQSIVVDMEQFKKVKQTAVLSRLPQGLEQRDGRWTGVCFADGQRVRIGPATEVVFGLTKRERELLKRQEQKKIQKAAGEGDADVEFEPLDSLDEVTLGMVMTYEGKRNPGDGLVDAGRIEFVHNDLEKGEKGLRDSLKVESKTFDGARLQPGELKINHVGKYKTLPDGAVQEYVADIGRRMIPRYQVDLPDTDPNRIAFQFHVIVDKTPNAFATPNGIVVVHSGLFDVLENEAQLAFILGHEVSHAVQEHTWRQQQYHKKSLTALRIGGAVFGGVAGYAASMIEGAVRSGYSRNLENQSDRLGLESMVNAGYDPRQAPAVWKVMAKKTGDSPTDFFWSSHDNHSTRRSYLMNELKNNYADVDYTTFTLEQARFDAMADRVRVAANSKGKSKGK